MPNTEKEKLPTLEETVKIVLDEFSKLPDERERAYEKKIVSIALRPKLPHMTAALTQLMASEDDATAFAAFAALCESERRKKNFTRQQELIAENEKRFGDHPLFLHIKLLQYVDTFDYNNHEMILSLAQESTTRLPQNAGAHHALADLVAISFEQAEYLGAAPPSSTWLEAGLQAAHLAICLDPEYAKFYCTKGRLFAARGDLDGAIDLITKAVDLEDSEKTDYAIRINGYLNYQQKFQSKKQNIMMESRINQYMEQKMDEYAQSIGSQQEELRRQTGSVMDELQGSMAKNLEFIGLFAGIISFTIGSISISSSLAGESFLGAAGLIVVLMGALLCVFAGFGIVLHGFETSKWKRNLVVFLIGLAAAAAGLILCSF